jgi:glutamate 5-kinase
MGFHGFTNKEMCKMQIMEGEKIGHGTCQYTEKECAQHVGQSLPNILAKQGY